MITLLKEVLSLMKTADYLSKAQMAGQLKISEAFLTELIAQLERMGYIREASPAGSCQGSCLGCPFSKGCAQLPLKMYTLTEKGRRALA